MLRHSNDGGCVDSVLPTVVWCSVSPSSSLYFYDAHCATKITERGSRLCQTTVTALLTPALERQCFWWQPFNDCASDNGDSMTALPVAVLLMLLMLIAVLNSVCTHELNPGHSFELNYFRWLLGVPFSLPPPLCPYPLHLKWWPAVCWLK